jgi:hypothetical protein
MSYPARIAPPGIIASAELLLLLGVEDSPTARADGVRAGEAPVDVS